MTKIITTKEGIQYKIVRQDNNRKIAILKRVTKVADSLMRNDYTFISPKLKRNNIGSTEAFDLFNTH